MKELIQQITNGEFDKELNTLDTVIQKRKAVLAGEKAQKYDVGTRVKFNDMTSPQYMIGVQGTIVDVLQKNVKVRVDDNPKARQRAGKLTRCPVSLLDVVE